MIAAKPGISSLPQPKNSLTSKTGFLPRNHSQSQSQPQPQSQSQSQQKKGNLSKPVSNLNAPQLLSVVKGLSKVSPVNPKKADDLMIEMSDDSEDDSEEEEEDGVGKKRSATKQDDKDDDENKNNNNNKVDEPVEQLLKTKRPRYIKPFTEELLVSANGLEKVYFEFPLYCKYTPKSLNLSTSLYPEGEYLKRCLTKYKEWAFQLHPGVSFVDVVKKCEMLGSKGMIRNYVARFRDKERDRYMNEVLLPTMRKKAEFVEFENRKNQIIEENKRKSLLEKQPLPSSSLATSAIADSIELDEEIEEAVTTARKEEQKKPSPNPADDDDEEWDIFDERFTKKPLESVESPTQIDSFPEDALMPSFQEESETQLSSNEITENNAIASKDFNDEEEDIFGDDSDEEVTNDHIATEKTEFNPVENNSNLEDTEEETFPQENFLE